MSHFPISYTGNKRQDIKFFEEYLPKKINNMYEPFCGSGAVSFHLRGIIKDLIILNDISELLIKLYIVYMSHGLPGLNKWVEDPEIKKEIIELCGYGTFGYGRNKEDFHFSKNTRKKQLFLNMLKSKAILICGDHKNSVIDASEGDFIYYDPPYIDTSNKNYSLTNDIEEGKYLRVIDNTKFYIEILEILKNSKANVMVIVNKNYLMEFVFKGFIRGSYIKKYNRSISRFGKIYKKITDHLIITNYIV